MLGFQLNKLVKMYTPVANLIMIYSILRRRGGNHKLLEIGFRQIYFIWFYYNLSCFVIHLSMPHIHSLLLLYLLSSLLYYTTLLFYPLIFLLLSILSYHNQIRSVFIFYYYLIYIHCTLQYFL